MQSSQLPNILSQPGIHSNKVFIQAHNFESQLPNWSFSTDSRKICKDSWFIALKGETFDGHKFCLQALTDGAKGLIVSELPQNIPAKTPLLLVTNTLEAYQMIARHHRRTLNPITIALTGSNGKTTTKEMLSKVLAVKLKTSCNEGNENNEIGVPKNILRIDSSIQAMVVECGMRGLGQIAELAKISEPDLAAITNIGTAHIGLLGSRENIAAAKCEIFRYMPAGKTAFVPFNEPLITPWKEQVANQINFVEFGKYQDAQFDGELMSFIYDGHQFQLKTPNTVLINNACLVIEIAHQVGLSNEEIQEGFNLFQPQAGRGQLIKLSCGATIIDETYNANPDSSLALARSMSEMGKGKKKILVLGEMAELGDLAEVLLKQMALQLGELVDVICLIGKSNQFLAETIGEKCFWFSSKDEACEYLLKKQNDFLSANCLLGFKASRSAKLEELIERIVKEI